MAGEQITPAEVGRRWGCHPRTVRRWAAAGRIRARRTPTGRWRIRWPLVFLRESCHEDRGTRKTPIQLEVRL